MTTVAHRDGDEWILDGAKTWISNAGIADFYTLFCRTPELGERRFGAFVVPGHAPGLRVAERIETLAPHPLGTLVFDGCRVSADALIGAPGRGPQGGARAPSTCSAPPSAPRRSAWRAARWTRQLAWCRERRVFGKSLAEHQLTRARLGEMATAIDASRVARLSRRVGEGRGRGAHHPRSGDGEAVRHGGRAAGDRRCGATLRRPRRR